MQQAIDYYKILQVDPDAELDVIKAAYRALSRKYHPDGHAPDEERMRRLNEAYGVLSEPDLRSKYNDLRERGATVPTGGLNHTSKTPKDYSDSRFKDIDLDAVMAQKEEKLRRRQIAATFNWIGVAIIFLACPATLLMMGGARAFSPAQTCVAQASPTATSIPPGDWLAALGFEVTDSADKVTAVAEQAGLVVYIKKGADRPAQVLIRQQPVDSSLRTQQGLVMGITAAWLLDDTDALVRLIRLAESPSPSEPITAGGWQISTSEQDSVLVWRIDRIGGSTP
jgi:hypothetical protein